MTKHEIKTCPKCKTGFECKTNDIVNCQCEPVKLEQCHRDYIALQFDDCLCADCLGELRSEFNTAQFTQQIDKLICQHK